MLRVVGGKCAEDSQGLTFESFYSTYPRKVARPAAEKAWRKLSPEDQKLAIMSLPDHIQEWKGRGDIQFVPYPASFLNGKRWLDELTSSLDPRPCRWTGCKRSGTQQRGQGWYCEGHIAALNRGETPHR